MRKNIIFWDFRIFKNPQPPPPAAAPRDVKLGVRPRSTTKKLTFGDDVGYYCKSGYTLDGKASSSKHFSGNFIVIPQNFLVIPRNFLVSPTNFLLIPQNFPVIPRNFLVIPGNFLVIPRSVSATGGFPLKGRLIGPPNSIFPGKGAGVGFSLSGSLLPGVVFSGLGGFSLHKNKGTQLLPRQK